MASLLEALAAREQAARARVEALRAELDRLAEQLAAEQALLERLEVTRQTVVEVLAGGALPGEAAVVSDPEAGAEGGRAGSCLRPGWGWAQAADSLPGRGGGAGRCRGAAARQAGVPGSGDRRRAQASGGDADQAQAAGRARLAGRGRAGAVRLRRGGGCDAGRRRLTAAWCRRR